MKNFVSVVVVLVDSNASFFTKCVASVLQQSHTNLECIVVDNCAKTEVRFPSDARVRVINNRTPGWYCTNNNIGIGGSKGEYVLLLNTDAFLEPGCVSALVNALDQSSETGSATPKLYRLGANGEVHRPLTIDTAGLYWRRDQRHLDRGAGELDTGQFSELEYIFGPSGAAAFYRKAALEDVKLGGTYLDEDFVHGREDADLAWRLQLRGWKSLYVPSAVGFHVRTIRPRSRHAMSPWLNCHQVKNRFLLRINNMTFSVFLRFLPSILFRDLQVVLYVVLFERTSLPAFAFLWKERRRLEIKRRSIKALTKVSGSNIAVWFRRRSMPAG